MPTSAVALLHHLHQGCCLLLLDSWSCFCNRMTSVVLEPWLAIAKDDDHKKLKNLQFVPFLLCLLNKKSWAFQFNPVVMVVCILGSLSALQILVLLSKTIFTTLFLASFMPNPKSSSLVHSSNEYLDLELWFVQFLKCFTSRIKSKSECPHNDFLVASKNSTMKPWASFVHFKNQFLLVG